MPSTNLDSTLTLPSKVGQITRVQAGKAMPFAREQASAINKQSLIDSVKVTEAGLDNDEQADRFFHGGAFQAVHQMSLTAYTLIAKHFPNAPNYHGILGENLIATMMTEDNVCLGDVYQIGTVQLRVTRPRSPCWKIDSQLNTKGVAKMLLQNGCCGWYYQVLQTGELQVEQDCYLHYRPFPWATLTDLWRVMNTKPEQREQIAALLDLPWLSIDIIETQYYKQLIKKLASFDR